MIDQPTRDRHEELLLQLHKAETLANIIIEHSFAGGDLQGLKDKGLNEGSFVVATMLYDLIRGAHVMAAEMFDAPAPEPLSTA